MKNPTARFAEVEIDRLSPSPFNPRRELGDLDELVESVRSVGILEPLLGRTVNQRVEVIAGVRRLAAAKKAGLKHVPVLMRTMTDEEAVIISVAENLQRGDLDLNDRLRAYDSLKSLNADKYSTSAAIARALGVRAHRVSEDYTAQEAMQRLKPGGVGVATARSESAGPAKRQGTLPYGHAVRLEQTMGPLEKKMPKRQFQRKYVEIAKEIAPLPREKAERVLSLVQKHPDKSTQEIHTLSSSLVERQVALPPETAQRLEERAKAIGKAGWEQAIESLLETPSEASVPLQAAAKSSAENGSQEEIQWLNKLEWNLREGLKSSPGFYTLSYEGRALSTVIEAVKRFQIKMIVDIRANTDSPSCPEFGKTSLERSLERIGVRYVHHPELGMPPEKLKAAAQEESRAETWKWYEREVLPMLIHLLRSKVSLSKGEVALLCEERDPTACHRHCIAKYVGARGIRAYDL
jgi:ParB/RepB/Spo0J family partition protein